MKSRVEDIARVCHEVNRAFCEASGDLTAVPWNEAPEEQRNSWIDGVLFTLRNPESTPEDSHKNWMKKKLEEGWQWGPIKNPVTKEHPCLVDYRALSLQHRMKDHLFQAVVRSMHDMTSFLVLRREMENERARIRAGDSSQGVDSSAGDTDSD